MICNQPIYLNCPFTEKDQAKRLGARFNGPRKQWFVPPGVEIEPFRRWLPAEFQLEASETVVESTDNNSLSLFELLSTVRDALAARFSQSYWVRAELVSVSERSGHVYIDLTEHDTQGTELAKVRANLWRSRATAVIGRFEQQTGVAFDVGLQVLLQVNVTFHMQYGFALEVMDIDPDFTLGELEAKLLRIREQLIKEGIYEQNRQWPLPQEFCRVAVIAPPQAAGLGDFRTQADVLSYHKLCEFSYYSASFQGKQTVTELPAAFQAVAEDHAQQPFDALVVIRGGGARGDLFQLNEYDIVRCVCTAPLPVIVGIGHERDETLLDETARLRCPTPSMVIGYITGTIISNARTAKVNWQSIQKFAADVLNRARLDSERLHTQVREQAMRQIADQRQQLDNELQTVRWLAAQQISEARHQLKLLIEGVLLADPQQVLARGYALVRNEQQQTLGERSAVTQAGRVEIVLRDGTVWCAVDE